QRKIQAYQGLLPQMTLSGSQPTELPLFTKSDGSGMMQAQNWNPIPPLRRAFMRRNLAAATATTVLALYGCVILHAQQTSTAPATVPNTAKQTETDEYTRYELLAPESASFKISYEVTATTPGAKFFYNPIRKGST